MSVRPEGLTLVIDVGKTRAKLLLMDDEGRVVERHDHANRPHTSRLGYPALDVAGLESWMRSTLVASPAARRCRAAIASTHGAAFVGLTATGELAWDPLDYEGTSPTDDAPCERQYQSDRDPVEATGAPDLPGGLNAARQLHWLQTRHPDVFALASTVLAYPQYWAWRLCGIAATEVSSLGCHTQLWLPRAASYGRMAVARGWVPLFAPMRSAWAELRSVRAEVARTWGLAPECRVYVGVHDSNACLARYLRTADVPEQRFTLVSSGTWTILMASGATGATDMLNVDVEGRAGPTDRFMGGRVYGRIAGDGASGVLDTDAVRSIVERRLQVLPPQSGGDASAESFRVLQAGVPLPARTLRQLPPTQRAALAALFCAQMTSLLDHRLWKADASGHAMVVDGPFAVNAAYLAILQALDPGRPCYASTDDVEGTARGAWMLCAWPSRGSRSRLRRVEPPELPNLLAYDRAWRTAVDGGM